MVEILDKELTGSLAIEIELNVLNILLKLI